MTPKKNMIKRPIIGVTLDSESSGGYSVMPWYALRQNYCQAILSAGGIPLPLPHHPELAEEYSHLIDGLILTGGNFDVPPALFGESTVHDKVTTKPERTTFEWDILHHLLHADKPILGICGGMQLINVALGGSLIQHLPDAVPDGLPHEQPNPRCQPGHEVEIYPNTRLHDIAQIIQTPVNSAHHQAVKNIAPCMIINAQAPDGVIEGIESTQHTFCLGVQWHPEYHISDVDHRIFNHFIKACTSTP